MSRQSHPTHELDDEQLVAELAQLYETRLRTLRYGADDAWHASDRRTAELEGEYLRRHPGREVWPRRVRSRT